MLELAPKYGWKNPKKKVASEATTIRVIESIQHKHKGKYFFLRVGSLGGLFDIFQMMWAQFVKTLMADEIKSLSS